MLTVALIVVVIDLCRLTVFPAKWISTSGSTRFFLLLSKPRICFIPSMKASSTSGREGNSMVAVYPKKIEREQNRDSRKERIGKQKLGKKD